MTCILIVAQNASQSGVVTIESITVVLVGLGVLFAGIGGIWKMVEHAQTTMTKFMEPHIKKIDRHEDDIREVKDDVVDLKVRVTTIETKCDSRCEGA